MISFHLHSKSKIDVESDHERGGTHVCGMHISYVQTHLFLNVVFAICCRNEQLVVRELQYALVLPLLEQVGDDAMVLVAVQIFECLVLQDVGVGFQLERHALDLRSPFQCDLVCYLGHVAEVQLHLSVRGLDLILAHFIERDLEVTDCGSQDDHGFLSPLPHDATTLLQLLKLLQDIFEVDECESALTSVFLLPLQVLQYLGILQVHFLLKDLFGAGERVCRLFLGCL